VLDGVRRHDRSRPRSQPLPAHLLSGLRVHGIQWLVEVVAVEAAFLAAFLVRYGGRIPPEYGGRRAIVAAGLVVASYTVFDLVFHTYRIVWRYAVLVDLAALALTLLAVVVAIGLVELGPMAGDRPIPMSVLAIGGVLSYLLLAHLKLVPRIGAAVSQGRRGKPVLIYGASLAGIALARDLAQQGDSYRPVAFLDDDVRKVGREIAGLPVVGTGEALGRALQRFKAEMVAVAASAMDPTRAEEVSRMVIAAGARPLVSPLIADRLRSPGHQARSASVEQPKQRSESMLELGAEVGQPLGGRGATPPLAAAADGSLTSNAPRLISIRGWTALLVVLDACIAVLAFGIGTVARFGQPPSSLDGVSYLALGALLPPLWLVAMALGGAYDRRFLAVGPEPFRRVATSAVWVLALVVFTSYALRADVSRGLLAVFISAATAATLLERLLVRSLLRRRLAHGCAIHRVLVVGGAQEIDQVVDHLSRNRHTGFAVAGWFSTAAGRSHEEASPGRAGRLDPEQLIAEARRVGADTIALATASSMARREMRQLSWALAGSRVGLMVVPGLADIAGPRISVHSVEGLPFLEISEPELTGARRIAKEVFDRFGAALLLILLLPVLVVVAVSIKLSDGGPILFRQPRIGKDGREFVIWKFRTMQQNADARFVELHAEYAADAVLLKIRRDPRVTRVGGFLRCHSLDELPQLVNVLLGSMSLVGPRPHVPDEAARFGEHARLRLKVKPGLTGPWQVGGRSDLPWSETVRLDLYYVENWSMWLDFAILWRTFRAVLRPRGAY
jgi:exopolysaccharide biosynthesis polyprenyl glycosylphosphotransferase